MRQDPILGEGPRISGKTRGPRSPYRSPGPSLFPRDPGSFPEGPPCVQAPTSGPGVLAAARVVIASRPVQWTDLGHSWSFQLFLLYRIHTKCTILGLPGGSVVRNPPSEAGDGFAPHLLTDGDSTAVRRPFPVKAEHGRESGPPGLPGSLRPAVCTPAQPGHWAVTGQALRASWPHGPPKTPA